MLRPRQPASAEAETATVNGQDVALPEDPGTSVAAFLRDTLGLRGTKVGCGSGECGACTVLLDGRAVCACLLPVGRLAGRDLVTVEGAEALPLGARIQQALVRHGAFQCGFCTPGVVMSLLALFSRTPQPQEAAIRAALQGNICRCSGYVKLLEAARDVAGHLPA